MKKFLFTAFVVLALHVIGFTQNQFQVFSERPNEKTYKGIISREVLMADTSFTWLKGARSFAPEKNAIEALKKNKDSIQLNVQAIPAWRPASNLHGSRYIKMRSGRNRQGAQAVLESHNCWSP